MEDFIYDPNVCPSSLREDDKPVDPTETAHKWDESSNPITCAECGTNKDEQTKPQRPQCEKCGYGFALHELTDARLCASCT